MNGKSSINAEWHRQHRMPKNPTLEERLHWHLEHMKHCQCRKEIPAGLKAEMNKQGLGHHDVTNWIHKDRSKERSARGS